MKTALAVLALAAMEGCATRTPAAPPSPPLCTRTAAGAALHGLTPSIRRDCPAVAELAPPLAWDEETFYSLPVGNDP